jgi:2-succinyl-5-enolpyruvyl-6-hydroxy-3-cyclohexene-1-carboxylate synthase
LVGDLAFLHDASGLLVPRWAAGRLDCTLVVVDNDGGGIFSFLPQAEQLAAERFERLLGTPQGLDLAAVAGVYGVTAVPVTTAADLGPAVEKSVAGGGVRIVHVRTDRRANVAVHEELHAAVEAAVGGGPAG